MKKISLIPLSIILIISIILPVHAANTDYTLTDTINLTAAQKEFTVAISVSPSIAYAGAEIGLLCSDGVTVKSISYSTQSLTAGPAYSDHLYWFSFFSDTNSFKETVTATVTLQYTGSQNTSIAVHDLRVYIKNGATVDTLYSAEQKSVLIKREGANNTPSVPSIPVTSGSSSQKSTSGIKSSSGQTQYSSGMNNSSGSTQSAAGELSSRTESSSRDTSATSPDDTHDTINSNPVNTTLLVLLILSVGGNIVLGYCVIKYKSSKKGD